MPLWKRFFATSGADPAPATQPSYCLDAPEMGTGNADTNVLPELNNFTPTGCLAHHQGYEPDGLFKIPHPGHWTV